MAWHQLGAKPLPEPMLTTANKDIWHHKAIMLLMYIDLGECPLSIWMVLCHKMGQCDDGDFCYYGILSGCHCVGYTHRVQGMKDRWTEDEMNWNTSELKDVLISQQCYDKKYFPRYRLFLWAESTFIGAPTHPPTHTHKGVLLINFY